eukprot:29705-Pelagococcus_subviridis.AAC.5
MNPSTVRHTRNTLGFFFTVTSPRSTLSSFAARTKSFACRPFTAAVCSSILTPGPSTKLAIVCASSSATASRRVTTSAAFALSPPVANSLLNTSCASTIRIFQSATCFWYTSFCVSSIGGSPASTATHARRCSAVNSSTLRRGGVQRRQLKLKGVEGGD